VVIPDTTDPTDTAGIGTLNEGTLHAALKRRYASPGDAFEVALEGFVIDLVKNPGTKNESLVEIQTGSFAKLGNKLDRLLPANRLLLVHPIAVKTVLERPGGYSRQSPKRGSIYSLFDELVSIPTLLDHPNLRLDVVLHNQIRKQVHDPQLRRRRGGFRTVDRHLTDIVDIQEFKEVGDLMRLLPSTLPEPFTTKDIATHAGCGRDAAQRLAFCFRAVSLIEEVGRTKAGYQYRITAAQ